MWHKMENSQLKVRQMCSEVQQLSKRAHWHSTCDDSLCFWAVYIVWRVFLLFRPPHLYQRVFYVLITGELQDIYLAMNGVFFSLLSQYTVIAKLWADAPDSFYESIKLHTLTQQQYSYYYVLCKCSVSITRGRRWQRNQPGPSHRGIFTGLLFRGLLLLTPYFSLM